MADSNSMAIPKKIDPARVAPGLSAGWGVQFATTPDVQGYGRVTGIGRHFGLPLAAVRESRALRELAATAASHEPAVAAKLIGGRRPA